jgi:TPR repeat protein
VPVPDTAYEWGAAYEGAGDLERAARWFRRAAEAGHKEAALRLGAVLGRLAERQGLKAKQSPELLAEATRWLSGVKAGSDSIELITDMLNRQQRLAARRTPAALNPR